MKCGGGVWGWRYGGGGVGVQVWGCRCGGGGMGVEVWGWCVGVKCGGGVWGWRCGGGGEVWGRSFTRLEIFTSSLVHEPFKIQFKAFEVKSKLINATIIALLNPLLYVVISYSS